MVDWINRNAQTMSKRFSQETKEKAREMRVSGMSYVNIAKEFGCSPSCVRFWCDWKARAENSQRMSVNVRNRKLKMKASPHNRDMIIALYTFVAQYNEQHGTTYQVDHIVPCHLGGEHSLENLRILPQELNNTGRPKSKKE